MGSALSYCIGSEETKIKLERAEQENQDLKQQLLETRGKYTQLKQKQQFENKQKRKFDDSSTTAIKILKRKNQDLKDKYSEVSNQMERYQRQTQKLSQENAQLRRSLSSDGLTDTDEKQTQKKAVKSEEFKTADSSAKDSMAIQRSNSDIDEALGQDRVTLRNYLVHANLSKKQLKTELAKLLSARTVSHRSKLPETYRSRYGSDIMEDIAKMMKKTSNVYALVEGLFQTRAEYDAFCIHNSISESRNSIAEVGEIVCCRNVAELQLISHSYKKLCGHAMKDAIYKLAKGKTYQNMINIIFDFSRNDNETRNKYKIAAKVQGDCEYLMDKTIKWRQTDNKIKLSNMLIGNTTAYVHDLSHKYAKLADLNLTDFVEEQLGERSTSGQLMKVRVEFATDRFDFYARRIQLYGDEGWKKASEINRIFVSRFDCELHQIRAKFDEFNYGDDKTMIEWLNKQCKHEKYAFFLTKMLENCAKLS